MEKNKPKITIHKVGPIEHVEIELNKVNVFMGPQSSGKSTIAKIISMCQWVEKDTILKGSYNGKFIDDLKEFHKLDENYFKNGETSIKYESQNCTITYPGATGGDADVNIRLAPENPFKNRKIIYIPAERNFVSSMLKMGDYRGRENNNVMNFLYDWYQIKPKYDKNHTIEIDLLGISFYHEESIDKDVVVLEDGTPIILQNASSGMQSATPLYLALDYLTSTLYREERTESPYEKANLDKIFQHAKPEVARKTLDFLAELKQLKVSNSTMEKSIIEIENNICGMIGLFTGYSFSNFIIEEPEQNLFPSTQRDLVYHLLQLITGERDHQLTITTHSPYILYALNNCMMAGLVYDKMKEADKQKLKCQASKIDPTKVSIYEIKDGIVKETIQRENGLISSNYFDQKMKELMDDFYVMLNYYGK